MAEQDNYIDKFKERREYFQKNFALGIGKQRTDVRSEDILKNSCPVCGYLTLDERSSYYICDICFWEDDGIDDFEENAHSGPNRKTLKESREIFQKAKRKLLTVNVDELSLIGTLKRQFINLDNSIEQNNLDKTEIIRLQNDIIDLLTQNNVHGLENLFNK